MEGAVGRVQTPLGPAEELGSLVARKTGPVVAYEVDGRLGQELRPVPGPGLGRRPPQGLLSLSEVAGVPLSLAEGHEHLTVLAVAHPSGPLE